MKEPTHNYCWFGGNTEVIEIRMKDELLKDEDLTGSTAKLGIKEALDDTSFVYSSTVNVQDDTNNVFVFTIPDSVTENLVPIVGSQKYYKYAIDITDSNNNKTTVLTGRILVKKNVLS
jgi:hypothetical protein